jgi:hypothetical protein
MGDGWNFLKVSAPHSLIAIYRMRPLSAKDIDGRHADKKYWFLSGFPGILQPIWAIDLSVAHIFVAPFLVYEAISLRFLSIILGVLRLEASLYNV